MILNPLKAAYLQGLQVVVVFATRMKIVLDE